MKRYSQRTSFSTLSEINVTPLLDLAFVLLIIFMITTPLLENTANITLPSSARPAVAPEKLNVQTISIDRDARITLNNEAVDETSLVGRLVEAKKGRPDLAVVIRPDRDLSVQKLIAVMNAVQQAQITRVGIATKTEAKP